jgi:ubiquinone/menaquinone biosynthesis C-methylase UbiE
VRTDNVGTKTMSQSDKVFIGSIPKIYDDYLVPLIFQGFAQDLAQRAAKLSPTAVLETAAGSGVVARALAPKLSQGCSYVVTDLNQPMLDQAAERQGADARITWQQADALALPFDDAAFDVVCYQFGVMFFPDRVRGYREVRRVLKPDGHWLFNVWDRIEENIFANDVTNALAEFFPSDPPRFLARTPHGYHDVSLIREELERAGFSNVAIETRQEQSSAPSARVPAVAYCQGTPLRNEIEARGADKLRAATEYAAAAIASRHGDGEVAAKIQGFVIRATP